MVGYKFLVKKLFSPFQIFIRARGHLSTSMGSEHARGTKRKPPALTKKYQGPWISVKDTIDSHTGSG